MRRDRPLNGIEIPEVKDTQNREKVVVAVFAIPKMYLSDISQQRLSACILRIKVHRGWNLVDLHLGLAFIIVFFFPLMLVTNEYNYFILIFYLYIQCLNQSHRIFWLTKFIKWEIELSYSLESVSFML